VGCGWVVVCGVVVESVGVGVGVDRCSVVVGSWLCEKSAADK
jgi:hypothetical protein